MIAQGTRLKDRYGLERLLGHGGMASVWLATDEVLERPVAIKVLSDTIASDPEFLARFRREARLAAGLSHPNLIGVYDYSDEEERPYLVMEYVSGETLAERMSRGAPIECERLARELLGALDHIHAAGIVHRDVKPQNVLIAPEGDAKLIDFGIALPRDATSLTQTGNLLGTARFIAPEVMSGEPATERADLYSCGVLLRDCVRGDARGRLGSLANRMAARDPRARPASAAAAVAELGRRESLPSRPAERLAAPPQPTAIPLQATEPIRPPPNPQPLPHPRRRPWTRLAAATGIVAGLLAAILLIADGPSDGGGRAERSPVARSEDGGGAAASREATEAEAAAVPEPAGNDPALGGALNQEGFEMVQAGRFEEAVPVLEEAVRAFPPETGDLNYAYALFNLGTALRLSGRPEEAIPVLERRLAIPNQTDVVSRELAAARSAADS